MKIANDLTIYSNYAHEWWDPEAPRFRSLINITPFRVALIKKMVGDVRGKDVYDLGCGGGLLSVPLLEAGANVTGMDLSQASIEVAQAVTGGRGRFIQGDVCNVPLTSESADIVLLADVLDHVPNFTRALQEATRLLRPGGKLFVGTINRTWRSWFFALFLGEGLKLIPPGTHSYRMFIKPEELIRIGEMCGLEFVTIQGEWPRLIETIRRWRISLRSARTTSVAYSVLFRKRGDEK